MAKGNNYLPYFKFDIEKTNFLMSDKCFVGVIRKLNELNPFCIKYININNVNIKIVADIAYIYRLWFGS